MCFGASIAKMLIDVSELRAWQALDLCGSTNLNFNSNQRFWLWGQNGLLL